MTTFHLRQRAAAEKVNATTTPSWRPGQPQQSAREKNTWHEMTTFHLRQRDVAEKVHATTAPSSRPVQPQQSAREKNNHVACNDDISFFDNNKLFQGCNFILRAFLIPSPPFSSPLLPFLSVPAKILS
jgi:hypothetical protein